MIKTHGAIRKNLQLPAFDHPNGWNFSINRSNFRYFQFFTLFTPLPLVRCKVAAFSL